MQVDISIKFDNELATAIMKTVREFSKELASVFDKSDWTVATESVVEPKPKQTKPAAKRKPRAKKTLRSTVLKLIKKNKDGISRNQLQEETGFSGKQLSNVVYQMRKNQKIEVTEDGLFKPV